MPTFKNHLEFCKSKHLLTTGNCHMKIFCEECQEIWEAAFESSLKIKEEVRKISDIIELSETGIVAVNFAMLKQKLLELL